MSKITFATRPSALARWQTQNVISDLMAKWPHLECEVAIITTHGDRVLDRPLPEIGGKGLFTHELERALLEGRVDAAVHSLKDLPTDDAPGLEVGVSSERADPHDVLVCPAGHTLDRLPPAAVVGTSSIRRRAQLLAHRPDLKVRSIRGNVDTRIRKALDGHYDAIVLAAAGVVRLGLNNYITQVLPFEVMLPAPGQGALGIQYRAGDERTGNLISAIGDHSTHLAVAAERAFLAALGGGCSLPVGALAEVDAGTILLRGVVASPDGRQLLRLSAVSKENYEPLEGAQALRIARDLGETLARRALIEGAGQILDQVEVE